MVVLLPAKIRAEGPIWPRGELLSEHRSNEDNCAILSTDRTREDAVSLESPTEGITTAFFTCENPHRIDDLHAPLVFPCFWRGACQIAYSGACIHLRLDAQSE